MKTWQAIALGLAAFVALIGGIVAFVFYATSGVTDAADEFFASAQAGDYEAAHQLGTQQLQQVTTPDDLRVFLEARGLSDVVDTSWSSRNINNNVGEVSGTVETGAGGTIPVRVDLVFEQEEWRISGIDANVVGLDASGGSLQSSSAPVQVPSAEEQDDLLFSVGMGLANSLREGSDFSSWKNNWVDQMSVESLEQNFNSLRPFESEIRSMIVMGPDNWEPVTTLNERGFLVLAGSYKRGTDELQFSYEFMNDSQGRLKLVTAEVNLY